MERETSKTTIDPELRELVRLAEHYGHATAVSATAASASRKTVGVGAEAGSIEGDKLQALSAAAQNLGTATYAQLDKVRQLVERLRNEAYIAGVADGERGQADRIKGS